MQVLLINRLVVTLCSLGFFPADLASASGFTDIANILKKSHEFKPVVEETYAGQ
jgi:hypothetical protein